MAMTAQDAKLKPGYKQTEVGVIPEDWEVKIVSEIADVKGGKRLPAGKTLSNRPTPYPYIRIIDMFYGGVSLDEIQYIPIDVFPAIKNYRISTDDIFITVAGTLGIVGKVPSELNGANLTENADMITSISCNKDYLLHTLMSPRIQRTIESEKTVGAQPKLALNRIKKFQIALPADKTEQCAIAAALSDVDALITSFDKLIAKKRDIKQATMQQLLTGKMRLPGFSGDGDAKLGDFFDLNPGKSYLNETDLVTFIRMEDVSENGRIINQNIMPLSSIKKGFTYFERNDVLVAKITPCFENGKGACLDTLETKWGFGSTEFHILRAKKNAIPRYIFYQTQTVEFRQRLEIEMIGTAGQKRVPARAIIDYSLPVHHSKEEQQAIATILSDMDAEIVALEQKRDKMRALKQGMMQELLTGKTRLL